jgi:hypothetical protein
MMIYVFNNKSMGIKENWRDAKKGVDSLSWQT